MLCTSWLVHWALFWASWSPIVDWAQLWASWTPVVDWALFWASWSTVVDWAQLWTSWTPVVDWTLFWASWSPVVDWAQFWACWTPLVEGAAFFNFYVVGGNKALRNADQFCTKLHGLLSRKQELVNCAYWRTMLRVLLRLPLVRWVDGRSGKSWC